MAYRATFPSKPEARDGSRNDAQDHLLARRAQDNEDRHDQTGQPAVDDDGWIRQRWADDLFPLWQGKPESRQSREGPPCFHRDQRRPRPGDADQGPVDGGAGSPRRRYDRGRQGARLRPCWRYRVQQSAGARRLTAAVASAVVAYFGIVYALGFALGTVRVLAVAPRIGELPAVLLEAPIMLAASWVTCRWALKPCLNVWYRGEM
jgi:hypothetical protein